MVARVRLQQQQQQQRQSSGEGASRRNNPGGGTGRTGREGEVEAGGASGGRGEIGLPLPGCTGRERQQPSPGLVCQGPEVRPVPLRLVSMLRLKTFKEEAKRAAEVELHDPAVCDECAQERAHLALTSFIWRKKTQLQTRTPKSRLNTHPGHGDRTSWISQSRPRPLSGFGREQLGEDMRVTATWGCLSNG
ncbi:uncharacterized protein LOC118319508 isoform X2 [Scophthalmus maximus]|nr:uncharacterized protein LOC118319508 isoform X2 [Scophthalmus maximus]